jgi:hypothetical protein
MSARCVGSITLAMTTYYGAYLERRMGLILETICVFEDLLSKTSYCEAWAVLCHSPVLGTQLRQFNKEPIKDQHDNETNAGPRTVLLLSYSYIADDQHGAKE